MLSTETTYWISMVAAISAFIVFGFVLGYIARDRNERQRAFKEGYDIGFEDGASGEFTPAAIDSATDAKPVYEAKHCRVCGKPCTIQPADLKGEFAHPRCERPLTTGDRILDAKYLDA